MRSPAALVLFLSVAVLAVVLAHRYLYLRMVRDLHPPDRWRRIGRAFWISAAVFLIAGMFIFRRLPADLGVILAGAVFCWMGLLAIILPITLLGEPVRVVARIRAWRRRRATGGQDDGPSNPGRRIALARVTAAATAVGSTGVAAAGVHSALSPPEVCEITVTLDRLPPEFDGLRIVQLSDIHVGPTIGRAFTDALRERVNGLKPDLVVLTGDLVDGSVPQLENDVEPLSRFESPYGTFFCTGNHEFYSGADAWCAHFKSVGIQVLRNARHTLERGAARLDIIGVDDVGGRNLPGGFDLDAALDGRDAARCAVLLCHQPKGITAAAEAGLDLVLSGHTHGGQIWPYGLLVALQQPYVSGLHRHTARTHIYVHTGTGYWGPPIRIRVPPQIAVITLKRPANVA